MFEQPIAAQIKAAISFLPRPDWPHRSVISAGSLVVLLDISSSRSDVNPCIDVVDPCWTFALVPARQLEVDNSSLNLALGAFAEGFYRNSRRIALEPSELCENPRPFAVDQCLSIGLCCQGGDLRGFRISFSNFDRLFQYDALCFNLRDASLRSLCRTSRFPCLPRDKYKSENGGCQQCPIRSVAGPKRLAPVSRLE